jgi:hypothetical protein
MGRTNQYYIQQDDARENSGFVEKTIQNPGQMLKKS